MKHLKSGQLPRLPVTRGSLLDVENLMKSQLGGKPIIEFHVTGSELKLTESTARELLEVLPDVGPIRELSVIGWGSYMGSNDKTIAISLISSKGEGYRIRGEDKGWVEKTALAVAARLRGATAATTQRPGQAAKAAEAENAEGSAAVLAAFDGRSRRVQYIFLDVVGFTHARSVEAQADIVRDLNRVVLDSVREQLIPDESVIYMPTGDGICIAIFQSDLFEYDVHVSVALAILERIGKLNDEQTDEDRQFWVRMGINENVDVCVIDVNGRLNVAGSGVNLAQRVMTLGHDRQILMLATVYESLRDRRKYMGRLAGPFVTRVKHGRQLHVYQLTGGNDYVSSEPPDL